MFPFGKAVVDGEGYAVTGRWPYASGCQHSTWLLGFCNVIEDRELREGAAGPEVRVVHFPTPHATIHDTWDTSGLCGTGSHDIEVQGEPVPANMTWSPGPGAQKSKHFEGSLYRTPFMAAFAWPMAAVTLGIAQGAIDELQALAQSKTPAGGAAPLRERSLFKRQLGDAIASVSSARAWLHDEVEVLSDQAVRGERSPVKDRARMLLAAANATRSAAFAVDTAYTAAGGTSVYKKSPLQRALRDIHALTQHVATSPVQIEEAAGILSGSAPGSPFILL